MSAEGEAFVRQVLKVHDTAPLTFDDAINYLRHVGKSGRGAAKLLGVSESTLRRWRAGTVPKAANQQRAIERVREIRTRPSTMGDAGVMLHVISADRKRGRRERDISGRQLELAPGTLDTAKQVWIKTGDPDAAYAAFLAGIGNRWYRRELTPRQMRQGDGAGGAGAGGGGGAASGGAGSPTGIPWDELDQEWEEALDTDYGMSIA